MDKYGSLGKDETAAAFKEDFYAWEERHFKIADKRLVRDVRDLLLAKGLHVRREAFSPVSKTLVEFRDALEGHPAQASARQKTASVVQHGGGVPGRPRDRGGREPSDGDDHNRDSGRDRDCQRYRTTRGIETKIYVQYITVICPLNLPMSLKRFREMQSMKVSLQRIFGENIRCSNPPLASLALIWTTRI